MERPFSVVGHEGEGFPGSGSVVIPKWEHKAFT
jgi:hypothetical protein